MISVSKAEINFVKLLQSKKYRDENNCFVAEGKKTIEEIIKAGFKLKDIYATEESLFQENYKIITDKQLQQMSGLKTPQNCIATFYKKSSIAFDHNNTINLVLDGIQDPGNMGTIIRTAHWFGIKNIVCSQNCADAFNPKTVQATMGSLGFVNLYYTDLPDFLSKQTNIPIIATSLSGENLYEFSKPNTCFVIMGSEGNGISHEVQMQSTHLVKIPAYSNAESLNVGVATGILCAWYKM